MTPVWVSAVTRPLLQIVVATLLLLACTITPVYSYTSGVNHIDRRAIAGLWRLTPRVVSLKEFTVHPKKENKAQEEAEEEMLLMLKEDGSFQRYEEPKETTTSRTSKEGTADIDQSWKQFVQTNQEKKKDPTKMLFKGTWDFRDGELILAADRDAVLISKSDNLGSSTGTGIGTGNAIFGKKDKDTILVGPVVLTKNRQPVPETPSNIRVEEQLQEGENATSSTTAKSKNPPPTFSNNQLSVPMGSVQVGRFMYPKSHPSFFEQPMFQPKRLQNFQLKQVLGNANAFQQPEEDQLIEKFRNKDFYNKTFFMTSHPIEPKKPKGRSRWSIKYNKFVEDPPNKKAKEAAEAAENRPANIRVMKVTMFPNNTFSSVEGVGDTILRGKFSVIGEKRDQLWMHITRFGFGRSVSGSVYSEGHGLSHEDAKSYWGKISVEGEEGEEEDNYDSNEPFDGSDPSKRLLVQGSVIYGFQLEPVPIGRFILREVDETDLVDDDEEDDDDDEENDGDEDDDDSFDLDNVGEDDGIDPWADSFQ